jgi:predicted Ser/Thr protein kinase
MVSGVRSWPDDGKFETAVARGSFEHPRLQGVTFDREASGELLHALGASAVVFFGRRGAEGVALRCPTRDLGNGAPARYAELAARRAGNPSLAVLAEAEWIDRGVQVDGEWWPVIVMERVEGRSLANHVAHAVENEPGRLRAAAEDWVAFVAALGAAGVAHGDLQQDNIFVTSHGQMKAVDLDGVWLPSIAHLPPNETGHRHYQHPGRGRADWSRTIDTFSALVIYSSLRALAAEPDLWERYHNGENLVFSDSDLARPDQTALWDRLSSSPDREVRQLLPLLRELCNGPADPGCDLMSLLENHRKALTDGSTTQVALTPVGGDDSDVDDEDRWWEEPDPDPVETSGEWFAAEMSTDTGITAAPPVVPLVIPTAAQPLAHPRRRLGRAVLLLVALAILIAMLTLIP